MELICPVVYFKQSQYMSESCVWKKVLYMYKCKRILRTLKICLDLTHSFVFLRLEIMAVIATAPRLLRSNDLHLSLSPVLH